MKFSTAALALMTAPGVLGQTFEVTVTITNEAPEDGNCLTPGMCCTAVEKKYLESLLFLFLFSRFVSTFQFGLGYMTVHSTPTMEVNPCSIMAWRLLPKTVRNDLCSLLFNFHVFVCVCFCSFLFP